MVQFRVRNVVSFNRVHHRPTAHRRKKQCPPHTTCRPTRTRLMYLPGVRVVQPYLVNTAVAPIAFASPQYSRYAYTTCNVSPRFFPLAIVQKRTHLEQGSTYNRATTLCKSDTNNPKHNTTF